MLQKIEVTEFLDSIKRSHPEFLESLKSEFLRTLKKEEFCRIMSHDRINSYQPFSTPDRHISSQFLEFLESLKEGFCRIHKKNRTIAAQITEMKRNLAKQKLLSFIGRYKKG